MFLFKSKTKYNFEQYLCFRSNISNQNELSAGLRKERAASGESSLIITRLLLIIQHRQLNADVSEKL